MREAMRALFGRPLYPAVAALSTIVLGIETTVDQVKGIGRNARKRGA